MNIDPKTSSILFVNRVFPPHHGATGRLLYDLADAFARQGWRVTVLTTEQNTKHLSEKSGTVLANGVCVHRIKGVTLKTNDDKPTSKTRYLAYIWTWLRLLFAGLALPKHDIIVGLTDPPLLVIATKIMARIKGNKHVNWVHDLYPDLLPVFGIHLPKTIHNLITRFSRRAMNSSDKIVVIGRCMAKHLIYSGTDAHKISVIPNWPDPELYATQDTHTSILPENSPANSPGHPAIPDTKTLPVDESKFQILYAGNLGMAHPYESILQTAEILINTNPEIEFVFVGDSAPFNKLLEERSKRNLENIRFLPYQPKSMLKTLMQSGDIHLISMKTDAVGLVVPSKLYSALAAGRPVLFIGPEDNETAQVIKDYKAGIIVPQNNSEKLADAIKLLRYDSQAWFEAQKGSAEAGTVFTPQQSCTAWIERMTRLVSP